MNLLAYVIYSPLPTIVIARYSFNTKMFDDRSRL